VILAAALYELTPAKRTCLSHSETPALTGRCDRISGGCSRVWSRRLLRRLELGLMAALLRLGVMNVTWMIVVAAVVAIEKAAAWTGSRSSDAVFIIALALAVALAPEQVPGLTIPG